MNPWGDFSCFPLHSAALKETTYETLNLPWTLSALDWVPSGEDIINPQYVGDSLLRRCYCNNQAYHKNDDEHRRKGLGLLPAPMCPGHKPVVSRRSLRATLEPSEISFSISPSKESKWIFLDNNKEGEKPLDDSSESLTRKFENLVSTTASELADLLGSGDCERNY